MIDQIGLLRPLLWPCTITPSLNQVVDSCNRMEGYLIRESTGFSYKWGLLSMTQLKSYKGLGESSMACTWDQ